MGSTIDILVNLDVEQNKLLGEKPLCVEVGRAGLFIKQDPKPEPDWPENSALQAQRP
jgi:hypothetical protein